MNATQTEAAAKINAALAALGLADTAKVGATGAESHEPYDGASADFDSEDSARRVHCYRDDDGIWMIDAMDASIGVPAPHPYHPARLIAYLVWATGEHDEAYDDLSDASFA